MAFNSSVSNTGSGGAAAREGVAAGEKGIAIGGNVEGGVHYHDAPITSLLRAIPPAPPAHFTGHESDLARLQQLLISGQANAIIALHGMGGIGKTSLALKLAEQLHPHFPGGVLWWSLGPNPDVITALDVWARHADPHADLSAFTTAASRAEVVRPMLSKLDKLCVFIDDVWDIESFSILKSALPPGCPILITTRDSDLAKSLRCRVEHIEALKDQEAVEVLEKLLGPLNGYASAGHEIVRLTEGLPLALELIAGIADSPSDFPSIVTQLRARPILEVLNRGKTRDQSIEVCFTMSYERLDENLQGRFRTLGVFAPAPFDRDAIAAVWGDKDSDTVDNAIQFLERRSLLTRIILSQTDAMQENVGVRNSDNMSTAVVEYKQHALLRGYAIKLLNAPISSSVNVASNGEATYDDFASRHATYYLRFAKEQNWHAIERVFDQIEAGWRWVRACEPEQIIDYVYAVQRFLRTRRRKSELLSWLDVALAQACFVKDRKNEGLILNNLGHVYDDLDQKDKALDFYRKALDIWREVGDRAGEGITLNNLGSVYDDLGQKDKALDFYRKALGIRREVGDRAGEGITLNNLGRVYRSLGQKDKALDFHRKALDIRREVGDRAGEGTTLNNLGHVYDDLGQKDKALNFYGQALDIWREVGDRTGEGITLNNLGGVYRGLGQKDKALDFYQKALDICREVGDRAAEGTTLNNLGSVYDDLGQKDKALDFYQQALAIWREVRDRTSEGIALWNIGAFFEQASRLEEAESFLEKAVAALNDCHSPDAPIVQEWLDRVRNKSDKT